MQSKGKWTDNVRLDCFFQTLSGHSQPRLLCRSLAQHRLLFFLKQKTTFCYMTFIRIFIWAPLMCMGEREECIILSLPHLTCSPTATASPWYPLPLQPTQTEILRLIMVSTDKMKKAIKCVQRDTLWSFSNILLPPIFSTVNTLKTQTTWPRGCKAGRASSLYASAQPDRCKQKPKKRGSFPSTEFHKQ